MKKRKKNSRITHNKNEDKFANKVIIQFFVCMLIFVVCFANSKLSNDVSRQINNQIKHYLCVSVDFDKVIITAKNYFESFINSRESVPVNATEELESKDDN